MSKRPNILIVMTDHERADSVLPEHPAVTPNVSRLFGEGLAFTSTFCPTPHCCPTRASFFSGLYPSRHGVWNNVCNDQALSRGLSEGVRLWSEDFADAGYRMHFAGKWHVSVLESPKDRGWIEHTVSGAAGAHHGLTWDQYRKKAGDSEPIERGEGEILRPGYGTYRLYGTAPDDWHPQDATVTEEAVALLPELAKGDDPWCLYVGLTGPHDPYVVPQRFLDLYDVDDVPLPPSYADEMADKPAVYRRMRRTRFGQLSGRILNALEATGQADDTLVLFTSDHADYCGEHGLWAKGIPSFRGAYNVPAVMRWPEGIRSPGRRVDELVSTCDFAPTFLEVAGLTTDRHFTGASLAPFLRDETPAEWRDEIHTQCNGVELYYTQRSVMTKELKYVFNGFDEDELYDLRSDPHEMRNLAGDPAYENVKREMCRRMWRFAQREEDSAINSYITVSLAPYGPAEAFREDE